MNIRSEKTIQTSLVIATYNWPEALELCFISLLRQSRLPDEIIIADDGSTSSTKKMIDAYRLFFSIPVIHCWHEDKGFRKTRILNKAIDIARGDYIIEIDGDVILHRSFVKDHIRFAKQGFYTVGRRASLTKELTESLLQKKSVQVSFLHKNVNNRELGIRIPGISYLFSHKANANSKSAGGSNMAFWRNDFCTINGYNNDLMGWGAEDREFAQRLVNAGILRRKLRFGAIQFHLFHKEEIKENHQHHLDIVNEVISTKVTLCKNGVNQTNSNFKVFSGEN